MAEFIEPGQSDYDKKYDAAAPTKREVADVLLAAADLLEVDGWVQRNYHTADGCHCALGAIGVASGYHVLGIDPAVQAEADEDGVPVEEYLDLDENAQPWYTPDGPDYMRTYRRYNEADRAVRELLGGNFTAHWNDRPEQDAEHVVGVIREAAGKVLGL